MTLTIAIPTFNRLAAVREAIESIIELGVFEQLSLHLLVIDNASQDETFVHLSNLYRNFDRVRILSNQKNIGFQANFARLFSECKTDYILICSDEDQILEDGLRAVARYVAEHEPAFLAPQFIMNERVYRGRYRDRAIEPHEARSASFYLSGLIWKTSVVQQLLRQRYTQIVGVDFLYPMYNICVLLLAMDEVCDWLSAPIAEKQHQLPTSIEGTAPGLPYYSVESRWQQHLAVDGFLSELVEDESLNASSIKRLQDSHRKSLAALLRHAMVKTHPELVAGFVAGMQEISEPRPLQARWQRLRGHAAKSRLLRRIWNAMRWLS